MDHLNSHSCQYQSMTSTVFALKRMVGTEIQRLSFSFPQIEKWISHVNKWTKVRLF